MNLTWKKHPVLQPLTDEEIVKWDEHSILQYHEAYHRAIENAIADPLKFGFHLEPWKDFDKLLKEYDEVHAYGGNRSSKTTVGARTVVNAALQNKNALILCFAQDATASVRVQQKAVYEWLPAELKQNIKSDKGYIKYSLKNGFTGESLILPGTNSTIAFHTYSQFLNNPGKFEGVEVGSPDPVYTNVGIWLDEYLLGPDLVDTLRFRLATRDAKMILTFTPIDGITEFLNGYISGAETLESRYVDRFPNVTQNVPYIQRATKRDAAMIYFHSDRNPFGGPERLERDLKGRDRDEILTRFYGVPVKMMTGQFPMFKRSINVMPHDDMMQIVRADSRVTRYMIVDPAPSKRWFVTWIAVADDDAWYVYREWPDKSYGDWAEIGDKGKSRQGAASKPDGRGIRQYVELFQELENGEKIHERLIDPRMGATPRQIEEGTTTIIQQLEEEGCIVLPAPGGQRINGISYLHGLMSYNDKLPIDSVNRPKFYVSDRCEQTIDSLLNYTASEAVDKDAWSDPIDTLMYGGAAEIRYLGNVNMNATRTRAGGY